MCTLIVALPYFLGQLLRTFHIALTFRFNGFGAHNSEFSNFYSKWKESYYNFFQIFPSFLFYVYGCFSCMYVCATCACNSRSKQERASDPLTGVTDECELPHACWESNPLKDPPAYNH